MDSERISNPQDEPNDGLGVEATADEGNGPRGVASVAAFYEVRTRGEVPADLSERLAAAHAKLQLSSSHLATSPATIPR